MADDLTRFEGAIPDDVNGALERLALLTETRDQITVANATEIAAIQLEADTQLAAIDEVIDADKQTVRGWVDTARGGENKVKFPHVTLEYRLLPGKIVADPTLSLESLPDRYVAIKTVTSLSKQVVQADIKSGAVSVTEDGDLVSGDGELISGLRFDKPAEPSCTFTPVQRIVK